MFEATLGIINAKAGYAATISARIAEGQAQQEALSDAIAHGWGSLGAIMAIAVANVVVGIWRPRLFKQPEQQ